MHIVTHSYTHNHTLRVCARSMPAACLIRSAADVVATWAPLLGFERGWNAEEISTVISSEQERLAWIAADPQLTSTTFVAADGGRRKEGAHARVHIHTHTYKHTHTLTHSLTPSWLPCRCSECSSQTPYYLHGPNGGRDSYDLSLATLKSFMRYKYPNMPPIDGFRRTATAGLVRILFHTRARTHAPTRARTHAHTHAHTHTHTRGT